MVSATTNWYVLTPTLHNKVKIYIEIQKVSSLLVIPVSFLFQKLIFSYIKVLLKKKSFTYMYFRNKNKRNHAEKNVLQTILTHGNRLSIRWCVDWIICKRNWQIYSYIIKLYVWELSAIYKVQASMFLVRHWFLT